MSFAAPNLLWLLPVVLGPLLIFYWWAWRRRQQLITQFISSRLLAQLKVGVSAARQKARMAMIVLAVICLILALARPQWGVTSEEAHQRGLDIVVAIDTSRSMLAEDVPPNRLARAKLAAIDLVRRAKTDRLGLVAFAGTAFLQCPLTLDDAAFSQSVDSLDTQTLSQGGTAIAEAIGEAARAFKHEGDNHKVLVLFTDGEDHDSEAVAAAEKAAKDGMVIFTVGIGSAEGDLLRIRDARGRVEPIRDQSGQPVKSRLNEDLLRQIATAAHGFYLPLRGARTMDTLYEQGLAPLPQIDTATRMFQRYRERFYWPLGLAMACLILEMFYPDRKHARRRPAVSAGQPAALEKLAGTAALLLLLLGWPAAAQAGGASGALREYNQGNFDQALRDYNQLLERKQDDPRLHFNAGAAAYQSRKLDEAVKQFQEALKSPDLLLQQRSYYNLANSLYRLGEQDQDTKKKQKAWETALQQYTNALALNQLDPDAKFNRDFVDRQLEELKKQQSQSQSGKDDQNKDDKKDGNNSKNDQKQDQQKKDQQQKQDQQKQDSQAQNQQDQKSGDEKQKQDQSQSGQQDKKEDGKKDTAQQQGSGKSDEDRKKEEAEQEAAMMAAGQMTPAQAQQLLDAQKGEEQVLHLAPSQDKQSHQSRPLKDW